MLKQIGIFILLLVAIQSCVIAQAADTTLVLNEFENLDSTKNPFLTQTDTNDYNCNWGGQGFIWSFKCMNEQFRRAQTPIHLSNYLYRNDPTSNNKNAIFYDSLIIADLFQDTEYFLTHWSERTYGYFKGKIIDQNSHYTVWDTNTN